MSYKIAAWFSGHQPFGDIESFGWSTLVGGPTAIDAFLWLTPGSTIYDNVHVFGLTGQFLDTLVNVNAQQATLQSYAGIVAPLGLPTTDIFPSNFYWFPNCRMLASEMVFSAPTAFGSSGRFVLPFRVVVRQVAGS